MNIQQRRRRRKLKKRIRRMLGFLCLLTILFCSWGTYQSRTVEAESAADGEIFEQNLLQIKEMAENCEKEQERLQQEAKEQRLQELQETKTYAESQVLLQIDKPQKREQRWKALARLTELTETYPKIEEVLEQEEQYPDNLLEALSNNPEMIEFVLGFTEKKSEEPVLTEAEKVREFPLFLQWDPRWGYNYYGDDSVIGLAGCGPTCLSMVLYSLTRDEALTPDKLAEYSMENEYYMYGTGTLWKLMEEVPLSYGVQWSDPKIEEKSMKNELDQGHVFICAVRGGDFTARGHFIMIYGYDEKGFLVNDPNCATRSTQSWSFKTIKPQIKEMWSYHI